MHDGETPVTYPIWLPEHDEYMQWFIDANWPADKIAEIRREIETLSPDRMDDFHSFLDHKEHGYEQD
jgi:hypothetical protein